MSMVDFTFINPMGRSSKKNFSLACNRLTGCGGTSTIEVVNRDCSSVSQMIVKSSQHEVRDYV